MFIRIATGIQTHFVERAVEWASALILVYWGARLTAETTAWSNEEAWRFMLSTGITENQWGWICVAVGTLRLLGLIINGTFVDSSRASETATRWVRGVMAGAGAVIWFMVVLSVSASESSGGGIYPLPLALDLWCSLRLFYLIGRASSKRARKGNAGTP